MESRERSVQSLALPAVYALLSIAIVAAILPTALRPPPSQPPSSAQLSPDAPPDEQQVLLTELSRGKSSTAGAGVGPSGGLALAPNLPPVELKPRKGRCFGNPPRQTESLYSAACAPAWSGENGGATAKGVSAGEINIGVAIGSTDADYEGPLKEPRSDESDAETELRTWQSYFNTRYEMYGRSIRFVLVKINITDEPATAKAHIGHADEQWGLFGFYGAAANWPAFEEAMRRKIVIFDEAAENPKSLYRKWRPYGYSFRMDADSIVAMHTEVMCKQLAGKPPEFNERMDPTFDYSKPRKFGLTLYEDGIRTGSEQMINDGLAKCGEKLAVTIKFNLYDNQSGVSAAVTRLRAAGVTTVLVGGDSITPIAFTREATTSGYFPEWWNFGAGGMESNSSGRSYEAQQWRHALGAFYTEIPRPAAYTDCAVAWRAQDPDNAPARCPTFRQVQQFANGIQGAGPTLNPDTFFAGLKRIPCRPPVPEWSIGGCYGDDDFTYPDYQSMVWWDPNGRDPNESNLTGAYRHMFGGRRFKLGGFPTAPAPWFRDGITQPVDPVQSS